MPYATLDELPYGFRVPALVEAVPSARRRVRSVAQGLDLALGDDTLATIELLAGEVIANAVTHTRGSCAVSVRWTGTRLRIEVSDPDMTGVRLRPRAADPDDESGRGLFLVATLADAWGTVPEPAGKTTWFEISPAPGRQPDGAAIQHEASAGRPPATPPIAVSPR